MISAWLGLGLGLGLRLGLGLGLGIGLGLGLGLGLDFGDLGLDDCEVLRLEHGMGQGWRLLLEVEEQLRRVRG